MLPFTKRPGRGDESGDQDVVTKDDVAKPAASAPLASPSARSLSASPAPAPRGKFVSVNDEEMTTLMSTKSLGDALPAPRPAAGAPPPARSVPAAPASHTSGAPSRVSSVSSASRSGNFAAYEQEEDGRTVVRGAPKIVKRNSAAKMGMPTSPTTISPAAVIKATLESARAGMKPKAEPQNRLMAGPPVDLLEDFSDLHPADGGGDHTAILASPSASQFPPAMVQGVKALSQQMLQSQSYPGLGPQLAPTTIPPGAGRPSAPPAPMSQSGSLGGSLGQSGGYSAQQSGGYPAQQGGGYSAQQSGGYPAQQSGGYPAQQSGGYPAHYSGPVPSGSVSVPGVSMPPSMPAHFMVPHAPYSDARIDPPGTTVTSRTKVAGRPATSWAIALAAFGLFVGVGAVAVTNGNDGGLAEASASFVDPSRAAAGKGAVAAGAQPASAAPTPVPVGVDHPAAEGSVGVPPVAVPAAPEAVAAPVVTTPAAAVPEAPVAAAAPIATTHAPVAAPVAITHAVAAAPAPVAKPAPIAAAPVAAPRPAPVPAPVARPARPAPAEEPVAAKPAKPGKPAKGDSAVDEEQRKALKALQESQLETPF